MVRRVIWRVDCYDASNLGRVEFAATGADETFRSDAGRTCGDRAIAALSRLADRQIKKAFAESRVDIQTADPSQHPRESMIAADNMLRELHGVPPSDPDVHAGDPDLAQLRNAQLEFMIACDLSPENSSRYK